MKISDGDRVLLLGLLAAMDKIRADKWNHVAGHVCEACPPGNWDQKQNVIHGICNTHAAALDGLRARLMGVGEAKNDNGRARSAGRKNG